MTPRWICLPALLITCVALFTSCEKKNKRILILLPETADDVVSEINQYVRQYCAREGIRVDSASFGKHLPEDSIRNYNALFFPADALPQLEYVAQNDLERYIQAGGGVFVVAPSDSVLNWSWYQQLTGERLATDSKKRWRSHYSGGRFFFAGAEALKKDPALIQEGLSFAIDDAPDYRRSTTARVPESNRFVVEVLDTYMYEPMEMVIFDDGRVLYLERRGDVKLYDPAGKKTTTIATFDVSIEGNYEDGMLGVALDPNYKENNWIYINYSPAGNVPKQNVSRFQMIGDSLVIGSEKIVLEIPTQRETCCHSGGHLEFGPNGDLYISTGDNTSSKESDGFTPIDERPGRAPFDAQKSSGNTHDLRGKILRIHPEPDGTYTIPEGNLFPKDGSRGKPEIYVMGTRNAFRFTVDDHNGILYWGDVGPDGGITNERGPESHDEFNQARKPGNYGWPYFVADNKAYADFDFATNKVGPKFNPDEPVNTSPNNTGSEVLPPAQKPMIWYPYGESREFPVLGTGSRSAMSGPVYYYDDFKNAKSRFPEYYDGKLFIYEWARSWVKVVSFDSDVNLARIEPFLPEEKWYKPIDMKFGPDGSLYVLQYGENYFEHNPDSRLIKITYVEGNREPEADLVADKTVGAVPLTVTLSAAGSFDFDRDDELEFSWKTEEGAGPRVAGERISVTYDKPGIYYPVVSVTDKAGKTATATVEIRAGNEPPEVRIELKSNRSFYFGAPSLAYNIFVRDQEDGSLQKGIDPSSVFLSFDYLKEGRDFALLSSNEAMATGDIKTLRGKMAIEGSDCKTCHTIADKSICPTYTEIAKRYRNRKAEKALADKIIRGGSGNWGKNIMAAHPQHSQTEAAEMVKYILSLAEPPAKKLPLSGSFPTVEHTRTKTTGVYVVRAAYTDAAQPEAGSLTGREMLILRHPKLEAEHADIMQGAAVRHLDGTGISYLGDIADGSYIAFRNIDLEGVRNIYFRGNTLEKGSIVEIRTGSPTGTLIGEADIQRVADYNAPLIPTKAAVAARGQTDLYFVFKNREGKKNGILNLDWLLFDNGSTQLP